MRCRGCRSGLIGLFLLFSAVAAGAQRPVGFGRGRRVANMPHRTAQGHVLVKFRPGADVRQSAARVGNRGMTLGRVRPWRWAAVRIAPGTAVGDACAWLRRLPGVALATPDPVVTISIVPNDPYFLASPQDPSTCTPGDYLCEYGVSQWALWMADAPTHWEMQTGSPSVVVAVIDSGVDLDHPELAANIWSNAAELGGEAGVDDDGNGYVDDFYGWDFCGASVGNDDPENGDQVEWEDNNPDVPDGGYWAPNTDPEDWLVDDMFVGDPAVGDNLNNDKLTDIHPVLGPRDAGVSHGTLVAGIIAATTDNATGFAGTAWSCKIMAVRIINAEGWGFGLDAGDAIRYAADTGADIINTSWGIDVGAPDPDGEKAVIADAVQYAYGLGCTIVSAAGNDGAPPLNHPGIMQETIAVGATTPVVAADGYTVIGETLAEFSNPAPASEIPGDGIDNDGNGYIDDVLDVVCGGDAIWNTWVISGYESYLARLLEEDIPPGTADYSVNSGTSFSTPLAAGYAALLKSQYPHFTRQDIRSTMRYNADGTIEGPGYDNASGFGSIRLSMSPGPTGIIAGQLGRRRLGREWIFSWICGAVAEVAGYNLYAGKRPDAAHRRLNRSLIPFPGLIGEGVCQFKALRGCARGPWYRLEAVYPDGRVEPLPPQRLRSK